MLIKKCSLQSVTYLLIEVVTHLLIQNSPTRPFGGSCKREISSGTVKDLYFPRYWIMQQRHCVLQTLREATKHFDRYLWWCCPEL